MDNAKLTANRPLSPHLQIYRPMLTMMMSIAHRISGASLAIGFLLLAWWLVAIAAGPEAYATVERFFAGIFGRTLLFLFSWALIHHMLGGIRHLIWDTGRGARQDQHRGPRLAHHHQLDRAHHPHLGRRLRAQGGLLAMATPLKRVRGLGAAHRGTETFWRQRVTAVANIPLTIFLILSIVSHIGAGYGEVRAYLASPIVAVLMLALVLSASIHMRIGLKEIIEDYVHGEGAKVIAIVLATFFAVGVALACTLAILKITLGA